MSRMRFRTAALCFALSCFIAPAKAIYGEEAGWHFEPHVGDCQLAEKSSDVAETLANLTQMCLRGRASVDHAVSTHHDNLGTVSGRAYLGLYHGSWNSVSIQATFNHFFLENPTNREQNEVDLVAARFGNSALSRFEISIGKQKMPFGLDLKSIQGISPFFDTREFWPDAAYGFVTTFDDQQAFTGQVGAGLASVSGREWQSSVRLIQDISALNGIRFIASLWGQSTGERNAGISLVNANANKNTLNIEWVRTFLVPNKHHRLEGQIVRVLFLGGKRGPAETILLYDDVRDKNRTATLAQRIDVAPHVQATVGVAYRKVETGNRGFRWFLVTGVAATL